MQLILETDQTKIVALEDFETMLSPSTGGIAVDRVPEVLGAIRTAASAIKPATMSPAELDNISTAILATAQHARSLADKAPADDTDAQAVLAILTQLGL